MDRVSETQLQVGENSDRIIWRLKGENTLSSTAEIYFHMRNKSVMQYVLYT